MFFFTIKFLEHITLNQVGDVVASLTNFYFYLDKSNLKLSNGKVNGFENVTIIVNKKRSHY